MKGLKQSSTSSSLVFLEEIDGAVAEEMNQTLLFE
jgi:hypothetical protein